LNLFDKTKLLVWYAGYSIKQGVKRIFNLSLTDPKSWSRSFWNLFGSQSLSGEIVTESTALTLSAVWNAISLISGTVGSLPLHLMQQQDKSKYRALDNPLYHVMHYKCNPYMTAMTGREVMMAHILTYGNGFAEIVRDKMGRVRELWPIPPDRVTIKIEDGELIYVIRVDGNEIDLPRERVLHIPGLGFDGYQGYSPIAMARKSIGLGMAMETYGSLYFKHGTHPGLIVSHPGSLGVEGRKNLSEALNQLYSGLGNTNRLMLIEESMKVERMDFNPEDSQFLQSREFQISEIARWFNLPPHKLKDLTKSSFNNIEQEQISFVTDSILPWLIRLEQCYYQQLITEREQKAGYYFKHIVEGLLRGDAKSRAEFYRIMINIGAMTRNEVREKEDMNPSSEPLADELFVMGNMIPLNRFEEYLDKLTMQAPKLPAPDKEIPEEKPENTMKSLAVVGQKSKK